jgi:hypothetical protein
MIPFVSRGQRSRSTEPHLPTLDPSFSGLAAGFAAELAAPAGGSDRWSGLPGESVSGGFCALAAIERVEGYERGSCAPQRVGLHLHSLGGNHGRTSPANSANAVGRKNHG